MGSKFFYGGLGVVIILIVFLAYTKKNDLDLKRNYQTKSVEVSNHDQTFDDAQNAVYTKIANDAYDKYDIAIESGSLVDACIQAGIIKNAMLELKDKKEYQGWGKIEKTACGAAGVSIE